jgi:hypothetical protein
VGVLKEIQPKISLVWQIRVHSIFIYLGRKCIRIPHATPDWVVWEVVKADPGLSLNEQHLRK